MSEESEIRSTGNFTSEDGSKYIGEYIELDGVRFRDGKGEYISGPERYEGDWKKDTISGKGTYQFASGASYSGDFLEGLFEGIGRYNFTDGAYYEGEWSSSKMHGQGCYTDPNGSKFEGQFFNGSYSTGSSYISLRPNNNQFN